MGKIIKGIFMETGKTKNKMLRAACGEKRCFYSYRIHEALARAGVSATGLAREIGVCRQTVSKVILGKNHSPRILEALRQAGVPEKYLFDPARVGRSPQ